MKKWFMVLLMIVPVFTSAQSTGVKFIVKGQVIDSVSQETIPYVTCSIVSEKNPGQVISRFAGDLSGKFSGELKSPGSYILVASCVGQAPAKRHFTLSATNHQIQLGKILMSPDKQNLKQLDVVASRPLIKAEADKISYDTEQDPEAKSSTVLDILRKVPMVTVDGQDNIQLKGSSNFKFFLNGKPTNMFNNNAGLILKSMPANMVKNIEVITQPGAKYDAEGVGGIINIVTIQQSTTSGYSATINTQGSSRGSYGAGLNLMLQSGKFSFSGNYHYNYNQQFPITTTSERHAYYSGAQYPYSRQVATVETPTPMQFGSAELSYELDTTNLFTLNFNRQYGRPESSTKATTENYVNDNATGDEFSFSQISTQKQTWGSTDLGLDYQHSFKKKGENLILSYKWSNTPNSSNYDATNTIESHTAPLQYGLAQWSRSNNTASSNEHTFQADYANPVAKGQTIEMGTKYIIRLNNSQTDESYEYFDFTGTYPYEPYIHADSLSSFDNNQDILGTYLSYTGNFGKWSLKGGLRYEYTWLNAEFDNSDQNFSTDYGALVPSAIITYRLTDMQSLKLGYNKRIQRPSIAYLNPYINRKDPSYISYGNPNLDPENSHSITLGYSSFAMKYNLSAELAYTFVNNAIEQYSFIPDGCTVQEATYANIGHNKQLGLNIFGNYRGIKWLNAYINSNVNYVDLKSNDDMYNFSNSGFTGRLYLGGTFMLPRDFRLSMGGGGNLPQVNLQGSQSAFYFSYGAFSKDFLQKRLNVSLVAVYLPKSHINVTTTGLNSSTGETTFYQTTDVHLTSTTEFRLNVSYRLGNLTAKVKKTRTTISNDDEKEKDNSSIGSSPM
ncbi:MAG: TonB-dependent receptor [Paludibacter sp.]|nr:TonB-dependent receptor [Paludibacter sp.]